MTFLDVQEKKGFSIMERDDMDSEMANRYLVLYACLFSSSLELHRLGTRLTLK